MSLWRHISATLPHLPGFWCNENKQYTQNATMKLDVLVPLVRQGDRCGRKSHPTLPVGWASCSMMEAWGNNIYISLPISHWRWYLFGGIFSLLENVAWRPPDEHPRCIRRSEARFHLIENASLIPVALPTKQPVTPDPPVDRFPPDEETIQSVFQNHRCSWPQVWLIRMSTIVAQANRLI